MDLRDHVSGFPYGQTWVTTYQGQRVTARKDYHTWTWRNGTLVTGLCIPGITLYQANAPGIIGQNIGDPLANPDGTEAVYGADDVPPPASTNWPLVIGSGIAAAAVVALFALAIRSAGRAKENPVEKIHKRSFSLGNKCGPAGDRSGTWVHRGGCHPARPMCRVARLKRGVCVCSAYHFPHRRDRNTCGPYAMPMLLRRQERERHDQDSPY
jgi:hypothetical protein